MEDVEPCEEMTALLSRIFCCGHFETNGVVCLAAICAGEEAFISGRVEVLEKVGYGWGSKQSK